MFAVRSLARASRAVRPVVAPRGLSTAAAAAPNAGRQSRVVWAAGAAAFAGLSAFYGLGLVERPAFTMQAASAGPSLEERVAALEIDAASTRNRAFVFIKPHAVNEKVTEFVKEKLGAAGVAITDAGVLDAKTIDERRLIDNHYGAIASKAMTVKPKDLNVPAKGQETFKKYFGETWQDALKANKVYNAADACKKLGITGDELDAKWGKIDRKTGLIKFGGGFYCGSVDGLFVINGFYMSMRGKFTNPPAKIQYYLVEWDPATLSWEDFRVKVLGATNPSEAEVGSVRREIYNDWEKLGLTSKPNVGDNGVHASASPFEAMAERCNWVGASVHTDAYARGMLAAGVPAETIVAWSSDPQVKSEAGKSSLFDLLEDTNSGDCLTKSAQIYKDQ